VLVTDLLTSPPILPNWQRDHGSRNIATNNARTTSQLAVSRLSTMPMIIVTLSSDFYIQPKVSVSQLGAGLIVE
jgi:hypothetical protein